MVLSDRSIRERLKRGDLVVEPMGENTMQPASIDLRLEPRLRVFRNHKRAVIDLRKDTEELTEEEVIPEDEPFILHPGEFILGSTMERVIIPDDLVARLEGKSSLGRLGLVIHSTAGFVDPGFRGPLTLELSNNATLPITLYREMRICQISFMQLTTPSERPYNSPGLGSRYQEQDGPTASRVKRPG